MKIKSRVWYWLAAASGAVSLLYGMGIEGGAQLGSSISDSQFVTALCLVLAAVAFLRLGFAAQDREQNARRYGRVDRTHARTEEPDYDLYILTGDSPNAVCTEFRKLIGHSYIPPKWAFGFAQSRWGYKTAEDVRAIARQYRENELPLDMICLDIDYMQGYADFTVNKERFPDLAALSA